MTLSSRKKSPSALVMLLLLIGIALLYHRTMARSIVEIDCGELSTVQALLGIAHPTGYPVFTLLGNIFLRLPIDGSVIYRLNLLSLLLCVAALAIFSRVCRDITRAGPFNRTGSWIVPTGATLFVAFNRTFWTQSSAVEVHALQLVLLCCVLLLSLRLAFAPKSELRYWLLLAVAVALGFSNHMTTVVVVPGFIYLFARSRGSMRERFHRVVGAAALFCVIVAATYTFLPIRASQGPLVNWGNPSTVERFWRHISGQQYRVWLFSSLGSALRNLLSFARALPYQFGYIGSAIGLWGIAASFRRWKTPAVFLSITFLCSIFYAVNYDIHDLDAYFLPSYLVFGVWIAIGLDGLAGLAQSRWVGRGVVTGVILSGVGLSIATGFSHNDRSKLFVYEDYTKSVLGSLPAGSILISYQWDVLVSPAYYYQKVEQYRDDVVIIDKELLRRSWYFDQLRASYPEVVQMIEPEVQRFVEAVIPFERRQPYDATMLERRYRELIARLIEKGVEKRAVFLGPELVDGELRRGELSLPNGFSIVPHVLTFQVVQSTRYSRLQSDLPNIRFPAVKDSYSGSIETLVSRMLAARAMYELYNRHENRARSLVRHLRKLFPAMQLPVPLQTL